MKLEKNQRRTIRKLGIGYLIGYFQFHQSRWIQNWFSQSEEENIMLIRLNGNLKQIGNIISLSKFKYHSFVFVYFICFVSITNSLQAETGSKYTGPIARSEKRILDGKLEYEKTGNFPLEWKLYFKAKQGDFVVFYDLNGDEIHFRYRRNKFDLDGELFVKDLFIGNPYLVKGEWIGYYFYAVDERGKRSSLPTPKKLPGEKKKS